MQHLVHLGPNELSDIARQQRAVRKAARVRVANEVDASNLNEIRAIKRNVDGRFARALSLIEKRNRE